MAMFETQESLDQEIIRLTEKLKTLDPVSDNYKTVRISLDTLVKLRNEQYRVDTEDLEKRESKEAELSQKAKELEVRERELALAEKRLEAETQQRAEENDSRTYEIQLSEKQHEDNLKNERNNRIRDYVTTGVNTIVGVAKLAAVIWFSLIVSDQGYKFEKDGCPTSQTFREARKNALDMVKDLFKKS